MSVPEAERATVRDAAFALLERARDADDKIILSQMVRLTVAGA